MLKLVKKIWAHGAVAAGKGAVAGTYDLVKKFTIRAEPVNTLLGILVLAAPTIQTADIASRGILQIDSADLDYSEERFDLSECGIGDPIATNNSGFVVFPEFIPLTTPEGKKVAEADISFKISSTVSITGGFDVAISVLVGDGVPTLEQWLALMTGVHHRARGGNRNSGAPTAVTATSLGTIVIPAYVKELLAMTTSTEIQDETAGEGVIGYVEYTCASIPDFQPQEWVFGNGWVGSLGTIQNTFGNARAKVFPTFFPLDNVGKVTVSAKSLFAVAVSNAIRANAGMRWR